MRGEPGQRGRPGPPGPCGPVGPMGAMGATGPAPSTELLRQLINEELDRREQEKK